MHRIIVVEEEGTLPRATVPAEQFWNLLEYLFRQRVRLSYAQENGVFLVWFPSMVRSAVEDLVGRWMESSSWRAVKEEPSGMRVDPPRDVVAANPGSTS